MWCLVGVVWVGYVCDMVARYSTHFDWLYACGPSHFIHVRSVDPSLSISPTRLCLLLHCVCSGVLCVAVMLLNLSHLLHTSHSQPHIMKHAVHHTFKFCSHT